MYGTLQNVLAELRRKKSLKQELTAGVLKKDQKHIKG